jgi:predicted phosphodiesterase
VELVLHGHYHESKGYFIKGILFSNAGNTINSTNDLNLNVINLSNNGHRIEIINLTVPQFQEEPFPLKSTINPKIVFA